MDVDESDVISAVFIQKIGHQCRFGVATLKKESKRITICELIDNDQLTTLEAVFIQMRPRTVCVFSNDNSDKNRAVQLLSDICSDVIVKSKNDYKDDSLAEDLEKLICNSKGGEQRHRSAIVLLDRHPLAKGPLSCLIKHYNLLAMDSYARSLHLLPHHVESALQMDRAALTALSIFPRRRLNENAAIVSSGTEAAGTLFGVLNKTRTAMGARKLAYWLSQPLLDVAEIRRRHDVVEALSNGAEMRQSLQADFLRRLPDLSKAAVKLSALNSVATLMKAAEANENPDSKEIAKLQLQCSKLFDLEELVKLYEGLSVAHAMVEFFKGPIGFNFESSTLKSIPNGCNSWAQLVVDPLEESVAATARLLLLVERTVDLKEAAMGRFVIARTMDASFAKLAGQVDDVRTLMEKERVKISAEVSKHSDSAASSRRNSSADTTKLLRDNSHGYVFRVPRKDHAAASKLSSCRAITLNKAEFNFTTPTLTALVQQSRAVNSEYERLQSRLATKACCVAATYAPIVESLASHLSTLDVLCGLSLAAASAPIPYCRPVMEGGLSEVDSLVKPEESGNDAECSERKSASAPPQMLHAAAEDHEEDSVKVGKMLAWQSGKRIELIQCRHPIAESAAVASSALGSLSGGNFFANDIKLLKENEDGENNFRLAVITGPNMGGKSTFIRQVALTCIMAQVGSLVPAQSATLPVLKQIFCRVGASDMQLRGVSTFFHEMAEASAILSAAGEDCLVVVDELGRGTSTADGFGLAWAIARHLAENVGCFGLFATHFHEMAALAEVKDLQGRVGNLHVSADVDEKKKEITFLYSVRSGGCSVSYGVEVATIAGMPSKTVDRAREHSKELTAAEKAAQALENGHIDQKDEETVHKHDLEKEVEVASRLKKVCRLAVLDGHKIEGELKSEMQQLVGFLESLTHFSNN